MINNFTLRTRASERGFHIITDEILRTLPKLPQKGYFSAFIQHTSAGLTINENSDPDVLHDFELYLNDIVPEDKAGLKHTLEGKDDMPSHIKSSLVGNHISVPIVDGKLALGTWQGIYLCEFRTNPKMRTIILTIQS